MICSHCGKETMGVETSPGTVSAICLPCNLKATGRGHHPDAYDVDGLGRVISEVPPEPDAAPAPALTAKKARR